MRVVVASCWKYRDAWGPFIGLFKKFWPERKLQLLTDSVDREISIDPVVERVFWFDDAASNKTRSWCEVLAWYLRTVKEPVLLMQEDFFLNAPVRQDLIDHALEQLKSRNAGMIRLYPCPGADEDYGDPHYGIVKKGSKYRISCQASIWNPDYLYRVASHVSEHSKGTPVDFELVGTPFSETQSDEVLAFKRDSGAWPIQYYCSAISRGKWERDAVEFCRQQGIEVDTTLREIA